METILTRFWPWIVVLVLVVHLAEEQLLPGGFVTWWNEGLFRSTKPQFPLSNSWNLLVTFLTIGLAIGAAFLALWCPAVAMVPVGLYAIDAFVHVAYSARRRVYHPGLVTAILVYVPFVVVVFLYLVNARNQSVGLVIACSLLGFAVYGANYLRSLRLIRRGPPPL